METITERFNGREYTIREWPDYWRFVQFVCDEDAIIREGGHSDWGELWSRMPIGDRHRYYNGLSWPDVEAVLTRDGWPEGAAQMRDLGMELEHAIGMEMVSTEPYNHVSGNCVDVAAYLSGAPECMINMEHVQREGAGKVLSILCNLQAHFEVGSLEFMNRGAATMAVIDLLESAGYRLEVWGLSGMSNFTEERVDVVLLKAASEPVDTDRLAFALCNPAFERRAMFAMFDALRPVERANMIRVIDGMARVIGCRLFHSMEYAKRFDLRLLSGLMPQDMDFCTFADARDWAIETLKKQGLEVRPVATA